jgi:hypothetical protein
MRRETLNLAVDREFVQRLVATGRAFDLERGGLYDARSGIVNVWCSPDDKPVCWNRPISRGGLRYPREYVGAVGWEWRDDERAEMYVEAAPYALLERRHREPLPEQAWQEVLAWLREKALALVRLAQLEPRIVGTRCPFCDFMLSDKRALVGLTLRYKTDDQLWFTFFHEIGHILLHKHKRSFVVDNAADDLGDRVVDPEMEQYEEEANRFAADTLIPPRGLGEFLRKRTFTNESINAFAEQVGIGPGIVVGRLQHDGVLARHQGNAFKQKLGSTFRDEG